MRKYDRLRASAPQNKPIPAWLAAHATWLDRFLCRVLGHRRAHVKVGRAWMLLGRGNGFCERCGGEATLTRREAAALKRLSEGR